MVCQHYGSILDGSSWRVEINLTAQGVASPEDIDTATKGSFGLRWVNIGVFESYDMIGIDTLWLHYLYRPVYQSLVNRLKKC